MTQPIVAIISAGHRDVFTKAAAASLVGQKPRVLLGFDWASPLGSAEVIAAELDDTGNIRVTLEVTPEKLAGAVHDAFSLGAKADDGDPLCGIGFHRESGDMRLRVVSPVGAHQGLSPRICTDPDCTIKQRPGFPPHGPHDLRAGS